MAEEVDLAGLDSDGGSEEVVLTPAELIERLEQVDIRGCRMGRWNPRLGPIVYTEIEVGGHPLRNVIINQVFTRWASKGQLWA
jgi:hypothetical protein